jgi:outer membrane cobalamin receptor
MRMNKRVTLAAGLALALCPAARAADVNDTKDLANYSLQDLLNMQVSVASVKKTTVKESPGIITVITRDDIEKSGARNLFDVLLTVPGFDFGMDTQGNIGLIVRGEWANEGKVLVLVDGQPMNELHYYTVQYARFDVNQIERIEIIRGPGSAMYGGNAEMAVISITTRTAKALNNGGDVYGSYGQMTSGFGEKRMGAAYGANGQDWAITGQASVAQTQISDRDYTDVNGSAYNMNGQSDRDDTNVNIGFAKKGLSLRFIGDDYHTTQRDNYVGILTQAVQTDWPSYRAEAKYEWQVSDSLKLVPRINYENDTPWQEISSADPTQDSHKNDQRTLGNLTAYYDMDEKTNFMGGAEYYHDSVHTQSDDETGTDANGNPAPAPDGSMDTHSLFLQGTRSMDIFNITAGARYEDSSAFGDAFVPRFALTKAFDPFSVKLMYSKSYRAPSLQDIRLSGTGSLLPEKTTTSEVEFGYQINKTMDLTANAFIMDVDDMILYYQYGPLASEDAYMNCPHTGTRGVEMSWQMRTEPMTLRASYSYYAAHNNLVGDYTVPQDSGSLIGAARNKVNGSATFNLPNDWSVSPSVVWLNDRNGYDENDNVVKRPDAILANLYVMRKNVFMKGLSMGIGGYNLFNDGYNYIQTYNGYHADLPSSSREFVFKTSYQF